MNQPQGVIDARTAVDYDGWRKSRWEEVAGPGGKAGVVDIVPIQGEAKAYEGLPGEWGVDGSRLVLTVSAADSVLIDGNVVEGTIDVPIGGKLELADGRLALPGGGDGRFGVIVWDPASQGLVGLKGIAAYPVDPDWVLDAEYRATPGRTIEMSRFNDSSTTEQSPAPADLVVEIDGEEHVLVVLESLPGFPLAVFTDRTSGDGTPEAGRWLIVPEPVDGRVTLDFNQAILSNHMFSPRYACPVPPETNALPVAVEAGERAPVFGEEA
jgi:uncharacterized protein (DUF1684 family)